MECSFYVWLVNQFHREDYTGYLAREIIDKSYESGRRRVHHVYTMPCDSIVSMLSFLKRMVNCATGKMQPLAFQKLVQASLMLKFKIEHHLPLVAKFVMSVKHAATHALQEKIHAINHQAVPVIINYKDSYNSKSSGFNGTLFIKLKCSCPVFSSNKTRLFLNWLRTLV
jgi:hypothetical protein